MTRSPFTPARLRTGVILLVLVIALYTTVYLAFPIGNDYYHWYRPVTDQWLFEGIYTLYDVQHARLFYPPWTMFVLLPFGLPPLQAGSALLTTVSLILILMVVMFAQGVRRAPTWAVALAVLTLFTVELLLMGQLDMFVMAGVVIGWTALHRRAPLLLGIGFCLMLVKPTNSALIGLVVLIAVRRWSARDLWLMTAPPLAMIVLSSAIVGFNWVSDYLTSYGQGFELETNTAIVLWRGVDALGLPRLPFIALAVVAIGGLLRLAWRDGLTWRTLAIAIATTLTFTPYAHADYYVMLIPVFLWVAHERPRAALGIWLLSFTPLLRLSFGADISWTSVLYAIALLIAAWFPVKRGERRMPLPNAAETEKQPPTPTLPHSADAA